MHGILTIIEYQSDNVINKYFFSIFMIFSQISVEQDEKPPHTKFGGNRFMVA